MKRDDALPARWEWSVDYESCIASVYDDGDVLLTGLTGADSDWLDLTVLRFMYNIMRSRRNVFKRNETWKKKENMGHGCVGYGASRLFFSICLYFFFSYSLCLRARAWMYMHKQWSAHPWLEYKYCAAVFQSIADTTNKIYLLCGARALFYWIYNCEK